MKRLFKNLMLVAVAAMAFVACSQDNDSINILAKKTVLHFNAGFADDTRSSFVEKEDGATSYKSVWNGGEQLIISICDSEGKEVGSAYAYVSLDEGVESAESMHFSAEYGGTIPENGSITVYSGDWRPDYSGKYVPYFDSEQRGATDYSVASNFHICKSNTVEFTDGLPATIDLTFSTAVAFGKITMSQFSDVADKIEEVKVTINDNTTYTVTPATLTKPVVWFAAEAVEAVTKLSIEAKVDGVTYVKTAEKLNTSFETGLVRPINVSVMTEKPADYTFAFDSCVAIDAHGGYWGDDNYYAFKFTNSNNNQEWYLGFSAEDITNNTLPIGTFEVTNNKEQGKVYGNGSYLLNIDEFNNDYGTYLTEGTVTISENEGVYNVLAKVKAYVNGGSRTIDISFEGTIAEPELPTFTSATYNGNASDKVIKLKGEKFGELWINFYGNNALITSDNWINVGQYGIDNGLYFGTNYGQYMPAGYSEWYTGKPSSFTLDVSIVDGQYMFVVNADYSNYWEEGVTLVNATYHGDIEGLGYPDLRTKLATPSNLNYTIEGNIVTITWDAVENAGGYLVYTDSVDVTTNENYATFELEGYRYYNFYVKALASEADSDTYRDSNEAYIGVNYEDPTPSISVNPTEVYFNCTNNYEKWVTVTVKNIESDITATSDNEQFSVRIEGGSVVISAKDNSTSEVITGTITVSAGNLSTTISVTQEAMPATLELTSAVATHAGSNNVGGTGYNITFTDGNGTEIVYMVQTTGHTYLKEGQWDPYVSYSAEGYISSVSWPNVSYPWPYFMSVSVVDNEYDITLEVSDYNNNGKTSYAHFKGLIENFDLP